MNSADTPAGRRGRTGPGNRYHAAMSNSSLSRTPLSERFRGFLPVVVDVETGGFDAHRHALLEIAVQPVISNDEGWLEPGTMISTHVIPHEGGQLDPRSLAVNGIDPWHPLRAARSGWPFSAPRWQPVPRFRSPVRLASSASSCRISCG